MINGDSLSLCNILCDFCVFVVPVRSDVFIVQTDASGMGISGVFSVCRDGQELPVGFYSTS